MLRDNRPLVTIGLPVYNGARYLRESLASLLAQDYSPVEIVIADNASTDETPDICRQIAARYPHVRYVRSETNVGMVANFLKVADLARGEFFQWAADDDCWDPRFISSLVASMIAHPKAVLATPMVVHLKEDGSLLRRHPDRPASADAKESENLRVLFDDHAIGWLYGLWRTTELRARLPQYFSYPLWGGDVMWLADLSLRCQIAGNQEAIMYKRYKKSSCAPRNVRENAVFWWRMFSYLTSICWQASDTTEKKIANVRLAWRYHYELCIQRPNLFRTVWRVIRVLTLAGLTSIPLGIAALWRRMTRGKVASDPAMIVSRESGEETSKRAAA